MTQPEALALADILDQSVLQVHADAAAELRRLHEANTELLEALKVCVDTIQTEIWNSGDDKCENPCTKDWVQLVKKSRAAIAKTEGETK